MHYIPSKLRGNCPLALKGGEGRQKLDGKLSHPPSSYDYGSIFPTLGFTEFVLLSVTYDYMLDTYWRDVYGNINGRKYA